MIAHVFTRDERLNARKLGGVTIGMSGVAVLIGIDALSDVGSYIPAELAVLAASLCYASGGIVTRRRLGVFPPLVTAQGQLWSATFLLLPLTCFIDRPWAGTVPGVSVMMSLIGLASISTALAYVIYFRLVNNVGATSALLVTLLIPIAALALGAALLGETLTVNQAAGMLLIFSGLAVIDGRVGTWLGNRFRRMP
jgi:drug/metabolite transporter (DMT)-like permease